MSAVVEQQQRVKVLVVEDHDDYRYLLQRFFERANCDVMSAASAESAIDLYRERTPHLAVIDLILPGMNGWELRDRMRVDTPECAVAISSSLEGYEYPEYDARLPKPVTLKNVHAVLSRCVPHWQLP